MNVNPFAFILTAVVALYTAYRVFIKETENVIDKQRILNDVRAEAEKSIAREISQVQQLFETAKNENLTKEQRIKAINELNRISPEYLGNLKLETIQSLEAAKAVSAYIAQLRKQAELKAYQKKLDDLAERQVTARNKKQSDYDDYANLWGFSPWVNSLISGKESKLDFEKLDKLSGKELDAALSKYTKEARLTYKERRKELEGLEKESTEYVKAFQDFLMENPAMFPSSSSEEFTSTGSGSGTGNDTKSAKNKAETERKKQLDDLKKHNETLQREIDRNGKDIYRLVQENEDARVSLIQDGYDKETAELRRANEKKIQALESQMYSEKNLQDFRELQAATEKELHNAIAKNDTRQAELLKDRVVLMASAYEQMLVKNKEIQENIITLWEVYNAKLSAITEKGVNERITKRQKEFEELKEKTTKPVEPKTEEKKDETPEWFLEFKKEQEDKLRLIQESQTNKEKQEIISKYVSDLGIPQWRMKGVEVKGETDEEIKNFLLPIKQDLIDAGLSEKYNEGRQVHDKQKEAQEAKEFVDHMPDKN